MNIIIKVNQYQGNHGHGYRSLRAENADNGKQLAVDLGGKAIVNFIEHAIQQGIGQIIANGGTAESFTITLPSEVTLEAELNTVLTQKYEADPLVSSLTFA